MILENFTGRTPQLTVISAPISMQNEQRETALLTIEVTKSIRVSRDAELTESPVEEGDDATDHYRPRPFELQIEGEISETPIEVFSGQALATAGGSVAGGVVARSIGGQFSGYANAAGALAGSKIGQNYFGSASNPSSVALQILEDMMEKKQRITITTSLRVYRDLMVTSLSYDRDQTTGRKLSFTMRVKQIRIVKSQEVKLPARKVAAKAIKKQTDNKQTPTPSNQNLSSRGKSLLKGFFSGGG